MDRATLKRIEEWRAAAIIDDSTAERLRAWEAAHAPAHGSRLGRFAFGFGGLLLGAGVLLFVAANWYALSPWGRFATMAATVTLLHVAAGAARTRAPAFATTLHAVGTAAFGGGVFLAGQTFNLAEQWPSGFLLWSLGAACALWLLRDWPHVLWVAVLVPLRLTGEWSTQGFGFLSLLGRYALPVVGLLVLSVAYLAAVAGDLDATCGVRCRVSARSCWCRWAQRCRSCTSGPVPGSRRGSSRPRRPRPGRPRPAHGSPPTPQ